MKALVTGLARAVRKILTGDDRTRSEQISKALDDLATAVQEIEKRDMALYDILEREAAALDDFLRPGTGSRDDLLARAVVWKTVADHALKRSA